MTTSAIALVLGAAVLHALWNLAAKRAQDGGYLFVFAYAAASAVLWLPLGLIVLAATSTPLTWTLLGTAAVSGLLHVIYGVTLQTGYARADLGVVYPVARGTGPLLTIIVAIGALGERPGLPALLGGLLVIGGVVVVATAGLRTGSAARGRATRGVVWGTATGASIAAYTLWDDHSVAQLALLPIPYFAFAATWQSALMLPGVRGRGDELRSVVGRYWREIACVAVLSPLAYVLVLQAMRTTSVALVAPVRESSIVVGSLLAWWLFGEQRPARRLIGALVVLAGIALLAY